MLKVIDVTEYCLSAQAGINHPLIIIDNQEPSRAYKLNYLMYSYFLVDISFSGRNERGRFLKIEDVIYLTYEEPCFYL